MRHSFRWFCIRKASTSNTSPHMRSLSHSINYRSKNSKHSDTVEHGQCRRRTQLPGRERMQLTPAHVGEGCGGMWVEHVTRECTPCTSIDAEHMVANVYLSGKRSLSAWDSVPQSPKPPHRARRQKKPNKSHGTVARTQPAGVRLTQATALRLLGRHEMTTRAVRCCSPPKGTRDNLREEVDPARGGAQHSAQYSTAGSAGALNLPHRLRPGC